MPDGTTDKLIFEEVKALLEQLRKGLVSYLPPITELHSSKELRLFEIWFQSNLHRVTDLAECALSHFGEGKLVPGCTLTRSVFETVGIQYFVHKKLSTYIETSQKEEIRSLLVRAVFGKKEHETFESPIQVLTAIDHMDKEFKGLSAEYAHLCEYAHPNLLGGFATYVRQSDDLESYFGLNPQNLEMRTWGLGSLSLILTLCIELRIRLKNTYSQYIHFVVEKI